MKNRLIKKSAASDRNSEKGLTLIELIIAMTIFMIVMSAVYGVLKIGNMSRTTINSRTENVKNVRIALNTIGREAVNAGLGYNRIGGTVPDDFTTRNFGLPADSNDEFDLLTAISAGNDLSESDFSKQGEKNDVVAFAFRDFQFNDGFPIAINDAEQDGDKLILKTPAGACSNCRPFDLFLIETGDGKQAVVLSTDIVNNNQIVLGGADDPLKINNAGKNVVSQKDQHKIDQAKAKATDDELKVILELEKLAKEQELLEIEIAKGNPLEIAEAQKKVNDAQGKVDEAVQKFGVSQSKLNEFLNIFGMSGGQQTGSVVKKCAPGMTANCINYGSTPVVAKKIYLVSYSVMADGTLIRTTFGNNTGAPAGEQILKQPIASGIRNFKAQYLLGDGTVTDDPSFGNKQKERCNDIIQIEVSITVESETNQNGRITSEPITLTSTFSTRNLKYDVY